MAVTKTSFKPGEKRVVRQKGMKNKKTILKEELGLSSWEQLSSFITGPGAEKLVTEIQKVKGAGYVYAWQAIAEFIKPKLARVDYKDESENKIPVDYNSLPLELRKQILDHVRSNTGSSDK